FQDSIQTSEGNIAVRKAWERARDGENGSPRSSNRSHPQDNQARRADVEGGEVIHRSNSCVEAGAPRLLSSAEKHFKMTLTRSIRIWRQAGRQQPSTLSALYNTHAQARLPSPGGVNNVICSSTSAGQQGREHSTTRRPGAGLPTCPTCSETLETRRNSRAVFVTRCPKCSPAEWTPRNIEGASVATPSRISTAGIGPGASHPGIGQAFPDSRTRRSGAPPPPSPRSAPIAATSAHTPHRSLEKDLQEGNSQSFKLSVSNPNANTNANTNTNTYFSFSPERRGRQVQRGGA
ncbi:unnamed protein product, partial [Pylaiella littoralis]